MVSHCLMDAGLLSPGWERIRTNAPIVSCAHDMAVAESDGKSLHGRIGTAVLGLLPGSDGGRVDRVQVSRRQS
jgi:hypothetical protein